MSPRQISKEFYKQQQRNILGFGIYYKNNNKLECINIDIISDVQEQSGFTVVSSFRLKYFYMKEYFKELIIFFINKI